MHENEATGVEPTYSSVTSIDDDALQKSTQKIISEDNQTDLKHESDQTTEPFVVGPHQSRFEYTKTHDVLKRPTTSSSPPEAAQEIVSKIVTEPVESFDDNEQNMMVHQSTPIVTSSDKSRIAKIEPSPEISLAISAGYPYIAETTYFPNLEPIGGNERALDQSISSNVVNQVANEPISTSPSIGHKFADLSLIHEDENFFTDASSSPLVTEKSPSSTQKVSTDSILDVHDESRIPLILTKTTEISEIHDSTFVQPIEPLEPTSIIVIQNATLSTTMSQRDSLFETNTLETQSIEKTEHQPYLVNSSPLDQDEVVNTSSDPVEMISNESTKKLIRPNERISNDNSKMTSPAVDATTSNYDLETMNGECYAEVNVRYNTSESDSLFSIKSAISQDLCCTICYQISMCTSWIYNSATSVCLLTKGFRINPVFSLNHMSGFKLIGRRVFQAEIGL